MNRELPNRRTAGFSLIEVLVALVILTIGIFAILRLFPGGFLTILRTSELTQAQGIVQQQLDAQKQLTAVADSIVDIDPATGAPRAAVNPDTIDDLSTAITAGYSGRYTDPYYCSNINRFLQVVSENIRITVPSANASGAGGAISMLQFGPVYNQFSGGAGSPADSLVVRGQPLQRTEQSSVTTFANPTAIAILANEAQYAIDYVNLRIAFYPRLGNGSRKFVFAYDYLVNSGGNILVKPVTPTAGNPAATTITVPDVNAATLPPPVWQDIFDPALGVTKPADFDPALKIRANSDEVSRKFKLMQSGTVVGGMSPGFDNDPYEYVWYSPQLASNANVGVLMFNPTGYSQLTATARGSQPLTARVDYTIFDNHIIREDRVLPFAGPYDIRLSLQSILINGYVGDPNRTYDTFATYNGMFRANGTNTPDILVYNVSTGDQIAQIQAGASTGTVGAALDDRVGVVRLNQADIESNKLQGASIRIFYRTEKEWGVQVQKANAHYRLFDTPAGAYNTYDAFYLGGSDGSNGSANRIYFPICESGKTVILGEYFVKDNANKRLRFSNEAFQVNSSPALYENLNGNTMTWIDITTQHSEAATQGWVFDPTQTGRAVSDVRGGSVRARAIWRDAGRWRRLDNYTFVSQPAVH